MIFTALFTGVIIILGVLAAFTIDFHWLAFVFQNDAVHDLIISGPWAAIIFVVRIIAIWRLYKWGNDYYWHSSHESRTIVAVPIGVICSLLFWGMLYLDGFFGSYVYGAQKAVFSLPLEVNILFAYLWIIVCEKLYDFLLWAEINKEEIKKMAKPIKNKEEIAQVATVSAQNQEIGNMIAQALEKVGRDGVITVEEGKGLATSVDVVEGMQFDRGYISPYMITDTASMRAVYENVKLLITDKKISSVQELLPLLEQVAQSGKKELVIIAEDVDGEALATLVVNKLRGTFNVLAVKAPAFGDRRKEILKDIAALTGGKVISEEIGLKLESATLGDLGEARKVISDKDNTTIVDGRGAKGDIEARVNEIKIALDNTTSDFDKEKLAERLAKLTGGVGVIKIGAATEVELKEKKHRIEDALSATKAAVQEGIVSGGGVALLQASTVLEGLKGDTDEITGMHIVRKALESPVWQIAQNAGKKGDVIVDQVKSAKVGHGYDAENDEMVDMMKAGIVDPKKIKKMMPQHSTLNTVFIILGTTLGSSSKHSCSSNILRSVTNRITIKGSESSLKVSQSLNRWCND